MIIQFPNSSPPRDEEYKRRVVTGFLVTGNSIYDLLEMLLTDERVAALFEEVQGLGDDLKNIDASVTKTELLRDYELAAEVIADQRNQTIL